MRNDRLFLKLELLERIGLEDLLRFCRTMEVSRAELQGHKVETEHT